MGHTKYASRAPVCASVDESLVHEDEKCMPSRLHDSDIVDDSETASSHHAPSVAENKYSMVDASAPSSSVEPVFGRSSGKREQASAMLDAAAEREPKASSIQRESCSPSSATDSPV